MYFVFSGCQGSVRAVRADFSSDCTLLVSIVRTHD